MKHVITVINIQLALPNVASSRVKGDHFIMKLIDLLIREFNDCSLGSDFRVLRFPLEINFKEHLVVIMKFPDWVQVKKRY